MMMATAVDQLSRSLESVVENCAALVRRVGWRHGLGADDVDEVFQDVRIRLWKAREAGEQISTVPTSYVYRTAMSAALDLIRRRRAGAMGAARETEATDTDVREGLPGGVDALAVAGGPEHALEQAELARAVEAAVREIPETRRPVVRMYLIGYPREEIAALMGWSEAKVRNLLYRGLADVRAALVQRGIGPRGAGV